MYMYTQTHGTLECYSTIKENYPVICDYTDERGEFYAE